MHSSESFLKIILHKDDFFIMEDTYRYAGLADRSDIALLKDVSVGSMEAFNELMDRYMGIVSRTTFRILCDRTDSEYVTVRVFVSLWHDVMNYDERFTLGEWLLRKACMFSRARIARRRILRMFGVMNDVFVNTSPKVEDVDDYVTKQAWELYCRAAVHMTPLQSTVYSLCSLEGLSEDRMAYVLGITRKRVSIALKRAEDKILDELGHFGREDDLDRFKGFLRKVSDKLIDNDKLRKEVTVDIEN